MSTENKNESSFFMKLTVKSLMSGFPNVKNISTQKVYQWQRQSTDDNRIDIDDEESPTATKTKINEEDPGLVVILVRLSL